MEPTLRKGERFTVEMGLFRPSRGDLIVFEHGGVMLIKRVIAITGDTVEGRNNVILVNGVILKEPDVQHSGPDSSVSTFGPLTVPAGQIFVAGDNRDYSWDSRTASFGPVAISDIKGRPVEIVNSDDPNRVHLLLSGRRE